MTIIMTIRCAYAICILQKRRGSIEEDERALGSNCSSSQILIVNRFEICHLGGPELVLDWSPSRDPMFS
ncbi:unnamed protein product [Lactuca virosa]|uniref:Uncharacterized protein n=1 Tax=Lactuca virosa TaxID=75947 RepID=A0AAU9P442_9ASTR|nr:unnamed protein product [Lactuca virosa]